MEYKIFGKNGHHNYYDERTEQWCDLFCAKFPVSDRVRNIYFGADGKPESYDCYKPVQNLSLTFTDSAGYSGFVSADKLEEYGTFFGDIRYPSRGLNFTYFMEVDDDGNYIPDETRHPITLKEVR